MAHEIYVHALRTALREKDPELFAAILSEGSISAFLQALPRRVEPRRQWRRHAELSRWLRLSPDHLLLLQARALLRLDLDLALHAYSDAERALLLIRAGGQRLPSLRQTAETALRMQLVQVYAMLSMRKRQPQQQGPEQQE